MSHSRKSVVKQDKADKDTDIPSPHAKVKVVLPNLAGGSISANRGSLPRCHRKRQETTGVPRNLHIRHHPQTDGTHTYP